MTIDRLPHEVLLEIFDSYRQNVIGADYHWRNKYAWFNLVHVCRRWREVVFASSSRLDLNIIVEPKKPGHIKTILSGRLPILIDYSDLDPGADITASALWRMRAALRHRDRVREISLYGWDAIFRKFIKATNYHFPALESLDLRFPYGSEPDIPATFLRGSDLSDPPLQRLRLYGASLASVSGLLLSAKALTNLTLDVRSDSSSMDSSQRSFLLASLQGMQCLRNLYLETGIRDNHPEDHSQYSTPKDIIPLSKLTYFHYAGSTIFLNDLMSGLSAPSLQDASFLFVRFPSPFLYLSRIIDDVKEEFRSVSVTFGIEDFHLRSSTHLRKTDHFKPSFRFYVFCPPSSIIDNRTPSTKLTMVEELDLTFYRSDRTRWEHAFSLREYLRHFRSVRVLRVNSFEREVGICLQQDETILPMLEEVDLSISRSAEDSDEEYQRRAAEELATFEPFVSARERAGRLVKVYHV